MSAECDDLLQKLRDEFDRALAVLREPGAGDKLREIFAASPQEIADAVNAAPDDEEVQWSRHRPGGGVAAGD